MRGFACAPLFALIVAGCASKSSEISASYISPITYQSHTCQQLALEAQAISARAATVSGAQDQKRTNDQIATTAAIIIFWPAAFFVSGDGPVAAELANLKGQMVAIEQASIARNCGIGFQRSTETGAAQPVYAQPVPPPATAPVQTKQVSAPKGAKGKQIAAPPQAAPPQTVIISEPPAPTLSEADRTMNGRN